MKIAVFGGTFDPPHLGHVNIVTELINSEIVDKVIILVSYRPPHKTEQKVSSFEQRCAMLELAFKNLNVNNCNKVEISKIEQERANELSYTINTLKILQEQHNNDEISLLIGSDSLMQLHTWYKAKEIVENYKIITYPRPNYIIDETKLLKKWNKLLVTQFLENCVQFSVISCASSDIREKISQKGDVSALLSNEVLCYIINNNLYQN